jgi:hypothetical protein
MKGRCGVNSVVREWWGIGVMVQEVGSAEGYTVRASLPSPRHLTHPDLWAATPIVRRLGSSVPLRCKAPCERIGTDLLSVDATIYDLHVCMYKLACLQDQQGRPQVEDTGEHATHRLLNIYRLVSSCYTANLRCIVVRRFHLVHLVVANVRPSSSRTSTS